MQGDRYLGVKGTYKSRDWGGMGYYEVLPKKVACLVYFNRH